MDKTKVFNLVILDRSGSMGHLRRAAVEGFNELVDGIRHSQAAHSETQEHNVTLVMFSGQDTDIVYNEVPVGNVHRLSEEDYRPYGMTPLLDAVGMALCRIEEHVSKVDDAAVVVTIITDGLENASREYTFDGIRRFIGYLSEKGWAFTLFGANQDSRRTAQAMGIRNARNFAYDEQGISEVFAFTSRVTTRFSDRLDHFKHEEARTGMHPGDRERKRRYSLMVNDAFDEKEQ